MARLFEVSLSGYYDWLKRGISKRKQHHDRCELLVKSAHIDTEQSYGHERLNQHLTNQGHNISLYMVFTANAIKDLKSPLTQIIISLFIQIC